LSHKDSIDGEQWLRQQSSIDVIPAKAGIHWFLWSAKKDQKGIPAFAGMTAERKRRGWQHHPAHL
jgi:hypothetical protein